MTLPKKKPARKTAKRAQKSPVVVAQEQGSEFPTFAELVTIAAAISTPDDDEKATARRALKLWKACFDVLNEETRFDEMKSKNSQKRVSFLAACGLTFDDTKEFPHMAKSVPVETFLKAINPKLPDSIRENWRKFWEIETAEVIPTLHGGRLPNSSTPYRLPIDPNGDMGANSICQCHDRFVEFHGRTEKATKTTNTKRGPTHRTWYAAANAVLDPKENPNPKQLDILLRLNSDELGIVNDHLKLHPKEMAKLMAAIEDARQPANARPRVIAKKNTP